MRFFKRFNINHVVAVIGFLLIANICFSGYVSFSPWLGSLIYSEQSADGTDVTTKAYDTGTSANVDIFKITTGDSTSSDPFEKPGLEMVDGVFRGFSSIASGIPWANDGTPYTINQTIDRTEMNQQYVVDGNVTFTFEDIDDDDDSGADEDYVESTDLIYVRIKDAAETFTADCNGTQKFNLDGTVASAGEAIECTGAGTYIVIRATNDILDGSQTPGFFFEYGGANASCAEETP